MTELYVVKIVYLHHMKFSAQMDHCDVKLFSSKEKAEEFLVKNDFLYGNSFYFTEPGWYHRKSINNSYRELPRLIYADIKTMKVDDENDNYWEKCIEYINFK